MPDNSINEISLSLGRIEEKCDGIQRTINGMKEDHNALQLRVAKIENHLSRIVGSATVIGVILGGGIEFLARKLHIVT